MRQRSGDSGGLAEFPVFRISPILESYGGEPVEDGYGWRAYRCPFHGDRQASASVNTTEQIFNCHAADCPKGNAVQIIMKEEGLAYGAAVERAITITGEVGAQVSSSQRRRGGSRGSKNGGTRFRRTWR